MSLGERRLRVIIAHILKHNVLPLTQTLSRAAFAVLLAPGLQRFLVAIFFRWSASRGGGR